MATSKKRGAFGRILRRAGRPGFYLRIRVQGREVLRYAGPDRRTAEEFRAETLRKVRREQLLGERAIASIAFREFEPLLLQHFKARHAPSTVVSESGRLTRVVNWFGPTPLKDIGEAEIQDFLGNLRTAEGLTVAATNRYSALLSVAFKLALSKGFARSNPLRGLPRAREQQRPVPFVSAADVGRLVAEARDTRFGALIRAAADTGLRRSELLALEWRDVHLGRKCLVVRNSKNKRPREVPLSDTALATFKTLEETRGAVPISGPDFIWNEFNETGPQAVSSRFKTVARRATLGTLRFHDLRHGFCSRLAQAGVPLPTIAALAGHTSWQTTQRYASHLPDGAMKAAIETMQGREKEALASRKAQE